MDENFAHFLEDKARCLGQKTALVWENGSLSWAELDRQACGFARHLATEGVAPGDRVAVVLPNRWTFAVAFLGILKVGATAAPLSPDLKSGELAAFLADLGPKRVIDQFQAHQGTWDTPALAAFPAVIIYTSGSTGRPKGAVFSHNAMSFGNQTWGEVVMGIKPEDVVLGVLPYSHNYGLYAGLLAPLLFGATVALVERFTPESALEEIRRHRVTIFPGVATMFRRILNSPAFSAAHLSSLRLAVSGAAPCASDLCAEWHNNTDIRIVCGYGMTEVPRPISYFADDPEEVPEATGRLVPGVEIRLVDEDGRPVPHGGMGELLIKSPAAMEAYLNDPDETQAVLREGWFKTGDLAAFLPGGFVRLVGRKRERILRGGYSIFPQEVEAVLCSHPAISEAAVVGVPDPDVGEEIAAFVALKPLAEATPEELMGYCKQRLAHYKHPRRLEIVTELPRNATGKILKSELLKEIV